MDVFAQALRAKPDLSESERLLELLARQLSDAGVDWRRSRFDYNIYLATGLSKQQTGLPSGRPPACAHGRGAQTLRELEGRLHLF